MLLQEAGNQKIMFAFLNKFLRLIIIYLSSCRLIESLTESNTRCSSNLMILNYLVFINPLLLFLDAAFQVFLHLTASPLAVRLNLAAATLLLLTQIPHLQTQMITNSFILQHNILHILCRQPVCVVTFFRCFLRSSLSSLPCFFCSFK